MLTNISQLKPQNHNISNMLCFFLCRLDFFSVGEHWNYGMGQRTVAFTVHIFELVG